MKNKQFRYFILSLLAVTLTTAMLVRFSLPKTAYWLFGLSFGFVLHRSRFCFASAFRDPLLFDSTGMAQAVLLMLGVSTVGFAAIQYHFFLQGVAVPGKIYPVGLNTVLGAFLFGLGMVLAGGCVCSLLARIGEGFLIYWWTLAGLLAGSLLGVWSFDWWAQALPVWGTVFLPDYLGWGAAVFTQIAVLAGIYFFLRHREKSSFLKRKEVRNGNIQA